MDKNLISICLEEVIFEQEIYNEVAGFDTAGKIGKSTGGVFFSEPGKKFRERYNKDRKDNPNSSNDERVFRLGSEEDTVAAAKGALSSTGAKVGEKVGQGALAGAYAGGAYLLYKGIKSLYQKYKAAKTPEEKADIKAKINVKKAQLQKAKKKGK